MRKSSWNRLASPAVLVKVLTSIRRFALIIIYFIYRTWSRLDDLSIFNSFDLFLDFLFNILPAFLIIFAGVMEYRKYRYRLGTEQFHVESGWIRREKKSIPVDKIQSVQIEQNWLYRILGIYLVKIDTIGEDSLEAEVGGVWKEEAILLRQQIQNIKAGQEKTDREIEMAVVPATDYEVSNPQILKYALTENILWFLLPLTLSAFLLYRLYESSDANRISWELVMDLIFGRIGMSENGISPGDQLEISYTLLYGLLLGTFYSGTYFFNKIFGLFNYRMVYQQKEVQIRRGWINRFETIIPTRKIQFTTWYTNLIRRKIGIYTLSYKYAGGRKTLGADAIVPFFDLSFLEALNEPYHPFDMQALKEHYSLEPVYLIRNFIFTKLPLSIGFILAAYFIHPWLFYFAFLTPVYFYFHNHFFVKNFKIYLFKDHFVIQKGVWGRRFILARWDKIQKITVRQTPYQRRKSYAHLYIHTAADHVVLPYLSLSFANQLMRYGLYKTEQSKVFLF